MSTESNPEPPEDTMDTLDQPDPGWSAPASYAADGDRLPGRPRRRYLTPLSALVAALALGAVGFFVGVRVEKSRAGSSSSSSGGSGSALASRLRILGAGGARGLFGGGAGGAGGGSATLGTVSSIDGGKLYVTAPGGNTVEVKLSSSTKVTKSLPVARRSIHPGDSVVISGAKGSGGSVVAATVSDSGSTGSSGTGSGSAGSGSGSGSAGSRSGSASSAVGSLFSNGG